jgi:hypothetical protein
MTPKNPGPGPSLPGEASSTTEPLFRCETGAIACRRHAPLEGSATWMGYGWRRVASENRVRWEYIAGKPMECQTCAHGPKEDA